MDPEEKKEIEVIPEQENQIVVSAFGSAKPSVIVEKATEVANAIKPIIIDRNLFTTIGKKVHVHCEGWTLMGALMGGFAQIVGTEDSSDWENRITKFKATCEVRTLDGRLLTKADSGCSSEESKWNGKDAFAIRSMAETRATSKAMRMAFGWIMKLAGYEPTPAEEIDESMVVSEEPKNGNGEVDKNMATLEKGVGLKKEKETTKEYMIRKIQWLMNQMSMGQDEFQKKVKNIESIGTQTQNELDDILSLLYKKHFYGKTIVKISVLEKKPDKK